MKAESFDKQFDEGADITSSLDLSRARRVLQEQKRVNVAMNCPAADAGEGPWAA